MVLVPVARALPFAHAPLAGLSSRAISQPSPVLSVALWNESTEGGGALGKIRQFPDIVGNTKSFKNLAHNWFLVSASLVVVGTRIGVIMLLWVENIPKWYDVKT